MTVRTEAALVALAVAAASFGCETLGPFVPAADPPGPTVGATQPPVANAPQNDLVVLRQLYLRAVEQHARMDSYIARLRRREVVNGKRNAEEVLSVAIRQKPYSVHFKWLGPESKGRELVYVQGQHGNKLNILTAAGDIPFVAAGKRMALDPMGALVRSSSRHGITEAGFGATLERINLLLTAIEQGRTDVGSARSLGKVQRPEFDVPVEAIEQILVPGMEVALPQGGRRELYLDPANGLPVLVVTYDQNRQEVEYYFFDRFQFPVGLDDADFDPDRLWPAKK